MTRLGRSQTLGAAALFIALALLLTGVMQHAERGLWIDEVSQLLNHPLGSVRAYFDPLPNLQQASPALFNAILDQIYTLEFFQMRVLLAAFIIGIIGLCIGIATKWSLAAMAIALAVLISAEQGINQITELKFYGLEAAGFAIFTTWIFAKDPQKRFNTLDFALLAFGAVLGISTLFGSVLAAAVFAIRRITLRQLHLSEALLIGVLIALGGLYYLQISHATQLQISTYAVDAYSKTGLSAAAAAIKNTREVFGKALLLCLIIGGLFLVSLAKKIEQYKWLLIYLLATLLTVIVLAYLGKYPVSSPRHVVWTLGTAMPTMAIVLAGMLSADWRPKIMSRKTAVTILLVTMSLVLIRSVVRANPTQGGAYEPIVEALEKMEPALIATYTNSNELVSLAQQRGAQINQHTFTYLPSLATVAIDPYYRSPEFLTQDRQVMSSTIKKWLSENEAGAWMMAETTMRFMKYFNPMAEFILDRAPSDANAFYVLTYHLYPNEDNERYTGLLEVLDQRGCTYTEEQTFNTTRSPGAIYRVSCP